jgi:hypothetical protein
MLGARGSFANSIKAGDSGNQLSDEYAAALAFSFHQSVTGNMMAPVYRAGFVAVQVRSIASESNEVAA